ncbi:MAG: ABC transporter ATP-binding protein [Planctomycetota bacterium]|nr:ABC transporter ATP-binding protein [Planctomycetota bacterium]
MIEIRNLSKRYGDKVALWDLNLDVGDGELFAFLGPNGAGKTTTIKILSGLVRPTAGTAIVGGHDVVKDGLKARALMSYVPDQPFLYEKLTAREFLRMVGELYRMERAEIEQRIGELSETFELGGFLDDLCESYSHGMKQRVVVASALLHGPKLLVVDEPMVGLDPKSSRTLKDLLRALTRERKLTVFMTTHTLSVAEEVADRIGIIHQGRVIALGAMQELRALRQGSEDKRLEDLFLEMTNGGDPPKQA